MDTNNLEAMLLDERGDDFWALLSEGDEEGNDFVNLLPEGDIFTNFISEHDFPPDLLPEENDNRGALELHEDVIFSHNNHEIDLNKFSLRATRDIEAGEIVTELPVICLLWDPTNIQPIKAREKKPATQIFSGLRLERKNWRIIQRTCQKFQILVILNSFRFLEALKKKVYHKKV